jgi:hypothetical protein
MNKAQFDQLKALIGAGDERERAATKRLATEHRTGHTGPLTWAPEVRQAPAVVEDPYDGMPFARREQLRTEAEADHRARRRRMDSEIVSRDRLYGVLRDKYGSDQADRMMR